MHDANFPLCDRAKRVKVSASYLAHLATLKGRRMPTKVLKAAKDMASKTLDLNGDGVVDHRDAVVAAKIIGAAAAGVGSTALASAAAGSAIVATGASAVAAQVTALAGAAVGAFVAATLGTSTAAMSIVALGPTSLFIGTVSVTTAVSTKVLAASAATGALVGQLANGTLAGLPVIQQIALSSAISANEIVLVAGVPMGVSAALAAGLIAIVIVGGYAYYLLTKDRLSEEDLGLGEPVTS